MVKRFDSPFCIDEIVCTELKPGQQKFNEVLAIVMTFKDNFNKATSFDEEQSGNFITTLDRILGGPRVSVDDNGIQKYSGTRSNVNFLMLYSDTYAIYIRHMPESIQVFDIRGKSLSYLNEIETDSWGCLQITSTAPPK